MISHLCFPIVVIYTNYPASNVVVPASNVPIPESQVVAVAASESNVSTSSICNPPPSEVLLSETNNVVASRCSRVPLAYSNSSPAFVLEPTVPFSKINPPSFPATRLYILLNVSTLPPASL